MQPCLISMPYLPEKKSTHSSHEILYSHVWLFNFKKNDIMYIWTTQPKFLCESFSWESSFKGSFYKGKDHWHIPLRCADLPCCSLPPAVYTCPWKSCNMTEKPDLRNKQITLSLLKHETLPPIFQLENMFALTLSWYMGHHPRDYSGNIKQLRRLHQIRRHWENYSRPFFQWLLSISGGNLFLSLFTLYFAVVIIKNMWSRYSQKKLQIYF